MWARVCLRRSRDVLAHAFAVGRPNYRARPTIRQPHPISQRRGGLPARFPARLRRAPAHARGRNLDVFNTTVLLFCDAFCRVHACLPHCTRFVPAFTTCVWFARHLVRGSSSPRYVFLLIHYTGNSTQRSSSLRTCGTVGGWPGRLDGTTLVRDYRGRQHGLDTPTSPTTALVG